MKRPLALCATIAAGTFGVAVMVHAASADPPQRGVQLGAPPARELSASADAIIGSRLPMMPAAPLAHIDRNSTISFGKVGELTGIGVNVNGVAQDVNESSTAFTAQLSGINGAGSATIQVTQTFADGTSLTVPFTSYIGDLPVTPATGGPITAAVGEQLIGWGDTTGTVGLMTAPESEAIFPSAVISHGGKTLILDTVNRRIVDTDGAVVQTLPADSFTTFASTDDGSRVLAIDPVHTSAVDLSTGKESALPAQVRYLPIDSQYQLDDGSALFVPNPADGVDYSIATAAGDGFELTRQVQRDVVESRAWVEDHRQIAVQRDLTAQPVLVDLGDFTAGPSGAGIIDQTQTADGTTIVLVAGDTGDGFAFRLVAVDDSGYRMVDVPFNAAYSMTRHLAVDGSTVTVASCELDGLHLRSYQL